MKMDFKNFNGFFLLVAGVITVNFGMIIYSIYLFHRFKISPHYVLTIIAIYGLALIPVIGFIVLKYVYLKLFETPTQNHPNSRK